MREVKSNYTAIIKQLAAAAGFSFCGISKAERLDTEAQQLERWLNQQRHGTMQYMENHFEKRIDPTQLMPGARSVISLMYNYFTENDNLSKGAFKIARYAYGNDYHAVIKHKLQRLLEQIFEQTGSFEARIFTDSAPVLEKAWAVKSGLGWQGKNTNLIHPRSGSYFFLAEIICDLELDYDGAIKDHCGTCTACVDACPTDALHTPYSIDANKCISYLTIELKDALIPDAYRNSMENWMFGCDICQEVCPWNRFSKPHHEPAFMPSEAMNKMLPGDWQEITEEVFKELFRHSAVKRTKFSGLKRNIQFITD